MSGMMGSLLARLFVRAEVESVSQVTPRMRVIRLAGLAVKGLVWTPGQQVRVMVSEPSVTAPMGALRTYSVWAYDGAILELVVLDHGNGPGARWARAVRAGDAVLFRKPEGTLCAVPSTSYHLFAGEETASVAFGAILGGLPDSAPVYGVIELASSDDRLPLPRADELTWQYRGDAAAASSSTLVTAVRDLDLPHDPGVAYLAGEARTCQAIKQHLTGDRGWPRRSVLVKPFWAPGKRGME